MKKISLYISLFIFSSALFAQEGRMSKAEALTTKADAVIQKEYANVGKVDNISLAVETITDLTNNQKLTALDMECGVDEDGATSTKSVLLDPDEVDALISFFQNLTDSYVKQAPAGDKEYVFTSRSGFEAGAYWDKSWKTYIRVNSDNGHTNRELNKDDTMELLAFLKQAKSRM